MNMDTDIKDSSTFSSIGSIIESMDPVNRVHRPNDCINDDLILMIVRVDRLFTSSPSIYDLVDKIEVVITQATLDAVFIAIFNLPDVLGISISEYDGNSGSVVSQQPTSIEDVKFIFSI